MGKIVYHLKEVKAGMLSKQNNLKDESVTPHREGDESGDKEVRQGIKQDAKLFKRTAVNESSKSPHWEPIM